MNEVEELVSFLVNGLQVAFPQISLIEETLSVSSKIFSVWTTLVSSSNQQSQGKGRAELDMEQRLMRQLKDEIEGSKEVGGNKRRAATERTMLGLVLLRLFSPPSVDPVQEMQLIRNCLLYQVCKQKYNKCIWKETI